MIRLVVGNKVFPPLDFKNGIDLAPETVPPRPVVQAPVINTPYAPKPKIQNPDHALRRIAFELQGPLPPSPPVGKRFSLSGIPCRLKEMSPNGDWTFEFNQGCQSLVFLSAVPCFIFRDGSHPVPGKSAPILDVGDQIELTNLISAKACAPVRIRLSADPYDYFSEAVTRMSTPETDGDSWSAFQTALANLPRLTSAPKEPSEKYILRLKNLPDEIKRQVYAHFLKEGRGEMSLEIFGRSLRIVLLPNGEARLWHQFDLPKFITVHCFQQGVGAWQKPKRPDMRLKLGKPGAFILSIQIGATRCLVLCTPKPILLENDEIAYDWQIEMRD